MKKLYALTLLCFLPFVTLAPTVSQAGGLDDETIFAIFDQANMADIATGRLGLKKSTNSKVRMLATMVVKDHSAVQQMGRDIAYKSGMLGTPPADDKSWENQAAALAKLDKLEGAEFDKAYVLYEIAYHTAVIDAINTTLLPAIKSAEFKGIVLKVLPGFEHHLAETKRVADEMGLKY
ncbi:DUF4142 domain-containing protein [Sneathiella sp. P13V-1]|uniref:DUF4142 domain-containing protein n=1 Tax=Sneathiella sp. P13V-1 TaxID=2697366 RepID=UPI00187B8510|nr:DUF4142 domain-containing protein [Sneathiella sp. P13V-1]MBE7635638.1 DUF4142 domain-containing protein [Sneathiella sp. P13V-1]